MADRWAADSLQSTMVVPREAPRGHSEVPMLVADLMLNTVAPIILLAAVYTELRKIREKLTKEG